MGTYSTFWCDMRQRELKVANAEFDRVGGQVPGYTGHVPGQRYIFAATYGKAARTAIGDENVSPKSLSSPVTKLMPNSSTASIDNALTHGQVESSSNYHIPGYTGHVHGEQHLQAKTYGQSTRNLIDPGLKSSEPELPKVYSDPRTSGKTIKDTVPSPTLGRKQTLSPKRSKTASENEGHRYAKADLTRPKQLPEVSKSGWIMREQVQDTEKARGHLMHGVVDTGATNSTVPNAEIARWESLLGEKHAQTGAYRVPGYTGHVHGSQHVFAKTYGEHTRTLLNTNREKYLPNPSAPAPSYPSPVSSSGSPKTLSPISSPGMSIYPGGPKTKSFKIPGYMGYVHGAKDVYAKTFGTVTRDVAQPPPKTAASMSVEQFWEKQPHPHKGAHRSSNVYYKQYQLAAPARNGSDVTLGDNNKYPPADAKSTYDAQHAIQSDKHVVKRPGTWQAKDVAYGPGKQGPPKYF